MLVLTRKSGEGIRIGNHVKIVILDIKDNQIKVGIEAPIELPVHREEIYYRIQEENRVASLTMPDDIKETLKLLSKKG